MFSDTLRRLRLERNLTQAELAEELGVSLRTIQYYEKGDHFPKNPKLIESMANFFALPPEKLFGTKEFFRLLYAGNAEHRDLEEPEEMFRLLQDMTTLFAGGKLSLEDRELFLSAVKELYSESESMEEVTYLPDLPEEFYV